MVTLLAAPAAMAEYREGPVGMRVLDFVLIRPTSFVISVVSTGMFIGLLPITFPMGVSHDLGTYMVLAPWRFTSSRYYGNFSECRDNRTIRGVLIVDAR
jgi:hypothetical protein